MIPYRLTGVKVHFLLYFQPCVTVFLWLLELELTELLSCRIPHNGTNLPLPVFRQPSTHFGYTKITRKNCASLITLFFPVSPRIVTVRLNRLLRLPQNCDATNESASLTSSPGQPRIIAEYGNHPVRTRNLPLSSAFGTDRRHGSVDRGESRISRRLRDLARRHDLYYPRPFRSHPR